MTVTVVGADRLKATTALAGRELEDMRDPGQVAAAHVLADARSKVPRVSGRLAGSLFVDVGPLVAQVGSGLDYAGRTHYGWAAVGQRAQPFLTDALADTEATTLRAYEEHVDRALAKVKGA